MKKPLTLLLTLVFLASPAYAGKTITSPYVTKGKTDLSTDGYFTFDDSSRNDRKFRERFTLDSGLTDQLGYRLRAVFEKPNSGHTEYSYMEIGGRYEFAEKGELPIDLAFYTVIKIFADENSADILDSRLLMGKETEHFRNVANLILLQEIGDNSSGGPSGEIDAKSLYKYTPDLEYGVEFYGNFGELNKISDNNGKRLQLGPVISVKIPGTPVKTDISYIFGITEQAEDGMLKWVFSISF